MPGGYLFVKGGFALRVRSHFAPRVLVLTQTKEQCSHEDKRKVVDSGFLDGDLR
jgi:hypothetical protein